MPKVHLPKRTFGLGEIAPEYLYRRDTDQYADSAKRMRNARPIDSGSFERRPGTFRIAQPNRNGILIGFYFNNSQKYALLFSDGRMDAYLDDGTAAGSVTGAPWTLEMLAEVRWRHEGDVVFMTHRDMPTQVITRTGAASWSRAAFVFDTSYGTGLAQPYYKFAASDVTIQPSATTGSITLVASEDFFDADHVGVRIRYLGREIEITAVTDGLNASGTVIQTLPAAQRLTVASSAMFQVGHVVEHDPDGTKGIVFNISDGTHVDVIPSEGVQAFPGSGTLVGPDGSSAVSGTASATLPALTDWDEQVCSAVRGYPGVVLIHRDRLTFLDHATIPDAVMQSKPGIYFNFDIGTGADADAIFEFFGDGSIERVSDGISAENLILCTNAGTYYVPERTGDAYTPTNFSLRAIDTFEAGDARAVRFERNIYYPHANGKVFVQVFPTGDFESAWNSRNIALFSPHLIRSPVSIFSAERFEDYPERYVFVANSDGTLAVLHSVTDQSVQGLTLWETDGVIKSGCMVGEDAFILVEREINGSTVYWLERFDTAATLDGAVTLSAAGGSVTGYSEHEVRVTGSTYDYGDVTVSAAGVVNVDTEYAGPFQVGLPYFPDVELPTPEFVDNGSTISSKIKRITKAFVHAQDSGRYFVNGMGNESYRASDDLTEPPPLRTEIRQVGMLGRSREPTVTITQEQCVPLKVNGVTMEVVF